MDSATLLALAARCEAASGPDRELDDEIAMALGRMWVRPDYDERVAKNAHNPNIRVFKYANSSGHQTGSMIAYTASLDAALSLAVDGHDWDIGTCGETFEATVTRPGLGFLSERGDEERYGHGATPALTLTAAWLRARAALA